MDEAKPTVLVVGANPAWQKSVTTSRLTPGEVVRVKLEATAAAGKGFNTAHAIRAFGVEVDLVSGVGPDASDWEQVCREARIGLVAFPLSGPIRTATTIRDLSTAEVTEIVEDGFAARDGADSVIGDALGRLLPRAGTVVVSGTFPPGLSPRGTLEALGAATVPVLIDSVPVVRCLREMNLDLASVVLKLNESEWISVLGGPDLSTALGAARRIWPKAHLLATRGKHGAVLWEVAGGSHSLTAESYAEEHLVHPIGAGDAFSAGLAVKLLEGESVLESCVHGMSVARASCLHPLPARFSMEDTATSAAVIRCVRTDA